MALDISSLKERLQKALTRKDFVKNLVLGLGILTIILLLLAILLKDLSSQKYGVLYTNLNPDDAGEILSVLQEEKIPYEIEGNGTIILVPKDRIYDVRLKLAAKGLPHAQNVGFELFNEPKMGITHFQENINYIRALEGELARTIERIDAIKDARVNIAMPQDSIFAREEDEPKASVVISLWPGRDLNKEQVKAIVFLVSHAVPKLKPSNVTVVDNRGRVLSDLIEQKDEEVKDIVDLKQKLRRDIEKSIQSMLAQALGPQKVVVRANVDVETANVNKEDQIIDPDKVAVVSERKIQEKEKGFSKKPLGAPGTPTNVPATINTSNNQLLKDRSKKDITTNYDISKSIIKTKQNYFKIKRISVGVLIDGKYRIVEENGTKKRIFEPRSEAEIKAYENLVKSAIGFDPKRGDKVTVVSVPFEREQEVMGANNVSQPMWKEYGLLAAIALLSLLLIGLIFFMILKAKKEKRQREQALIQAMKEGVEGAAQAAHELREKEDFSLEKEPVYQQIIKIIDENPDIVANMVSKWIKEEK